VQWSRLLDKLIAKELPHDRAVAGEVAFKGADVLKAFRPDAFGHEWRGQFLSGEKLRVHPHHERLFVVAAVEDADAPALRELLHAAPEIVVIQVFIGRCLEGRHLAALRIHARHHMLDRPVFPRGIHGLKDEQHRPAILRVEDILQLGERFHSGLEGFLGVGFARRLQFPGVLRIEIPEPEFPATGDAIG